jgi:hypothetical protein
MDVVYAVRVNSFLPAARASAIRSGLFLTYRFLGILGVMWYCAHVDVVGMKLKR